jgi:hypothetical protein
MTARELGHLYGLMRPGERLAGLVVAVIGGRRTWRLVMVRDGARRVVVGGDEQQAGAA